MGIMRLKVEGELAPCKQGKYNAGVPVYSLIVFLVDTGEAGDKKRAQRAVIIDET